MQDRVPLYPGRVKMTPVAGQTNTFDMVRADDPTQEGTPLNKATLLKDATAALYGLGTGAVPDDVLAELGKYKQYWWRRRIHTVTWEISTTTKGNNIIVRSNGTVQYSDSIHVENDGTIALDDPKTSVPANYDNRDAFNNAIKNYWKYGNWSDRSNVWYGGSPVTNWSDDHPNSFTNLKQVIATKTSENIGEWEFIQDTNRNAYPDSGNKDGFDYQYIGVPLDNAVTASEIETGSYVGTGTYGQENPNTLTFEFVPKFVIFWQGSIGSSVVNVNSTNPFYWIYNGDKMFPTSSTNNYNCFVTLNGNTLTWYSPRNEYAQYNDETKEYHYVAIG